MIPRGPFTPAAERVSWTGACGMGHSHDCFWGPVPCQPVSKDCESGACWFLWRRGLGAPRFRRRPLHLWAPRAQQRSRCPRPRCLEQAGPGCPCPRGAWSSSCRLVPCRDLDGRGLCCVWRKMERKLPDDHKDSKPIRRKDKHDSLTQEAASSVDGGRDCAQAKPAVSLAEGRRTGQGLRESGRR